MVDYREILRLSSNPKNGQRMIASAVHSSRHTIHDVQEAARKAGITWPLDESVTNDALKSILFPEKSSATSIYVQPDFAYIHSELAKPGVNLTLLCILRRPAAADAELNGRDAVCQRPAGLRY